MTRSWSSVTKASGELSVCARSMLAARSRSWAMRCISSCWRCRSRAWRPMRKNTSALDFSTTGSIGLTM
jgi:hypothetical protein